MIAKVINNTPSVKILSAHTRRKEKKKEKKWSERANKLTEKVVLDPHEEREPLFSHFPHITPEHSRERVAYVFVKGAKEGRRKKDDVDYETGREGGGKRIVV